MFIKGDILIVGLQTIGYKDDKLFILSMEEYERFKENIPEFNCWQWLRSPDNGMNYALYVNYFGVPNHYGTHVHNTEYGVRPAMISYISEYQIGDRIYKYDFPFICIGKLEDNNSLFISEVPIATHRFDKESNTYETSEIRKFLKDWIKERC